MAVGALYVPDKDWPVETILNLALSVTMVPKIRSID